MIGKGAIDWPSVSEPGRPYRKIIDLRSLLPATWCGIHRRHITEMGLCYLCLVEFREKYRERCKINPLSWIECSVCRYPLHPVVEAEGFGTCPACDVPARPFSTAEIAAFSANETSKLEPLK